MSFIKLKHFINDAQRFPANVEERDFWKKKGTKHFTASSCFEDLGDINSCLMIFVNNKFGTSDFISQDLLELYVKASPSVFFYQSSIW